jgi:transcription initiation factor TFIIH subunit 4
MEEDLLRYLQGLPTAVLINLYGYSAACLAVFRELPELSKQYVMRLLFLEQPLSQSVIDSWSHPSSNRSHNEAITRLKSLRVYEVSALPGGQQGVTLNENFRVNLRVLVCGGGTPWALVGHRGGEAKHTRDTAFLNDYADRQWEGVLNFMVGGKGETSTEVEVKHILEKSNLMASPQGGGRGLVITTRGFQFLLMERSSQVWFFIMNYLEVVTERGFDLLECLTFIFQLSFSTLGKDYSREGLTECQEKLVQHLRMFGLVYQRKRSSKRYYPTKLAINLVSGASLSHTVSSSPHKAAGFIVIETNFRVIAYTDSQLQIAILALFCQLQYRFPNMAVGTITRESIHQV